MRSEQLWWGLGSGMYSREQLLSRGVPASVLSLASKAGPWLRLQPGVYVEREVHLARLPAERHRVAVA
ncbi:hypothetical protein P2P98_11635, partial [Microbacterium sp. Kw_RZR3]|uniref:hypothetical protein n=1 Tax=Microbacterium sp. Kw_RZR3 TaxID=3032903 RepID=UPI0023DC4D75